MTKKSFVISRMGTEIFVDKVDPKPRPPLATVAPEERETRRPRPEVASCSEDDQRPFPVSQPF